MNPPEELGPESPLLLLRFTLGRATFGVDIEQLATISVYGGEVGDDLCWLHRELGYRAAPPYRDPRILSVKGDKAKGLRSYRLITEAPEEVREFDWRDIRPFPPLLEPCLGSRGLWGVLPFDNAMILLLDCHRLNISEKI